MYAYYSFRELLSTLKKEFKITEKQAKTFLYLFTEEEISLLAAFEVYQVNDDIQEFVNTLKIIEKIQFFQNESKYFDSNATFSDDTEY